MDEVWPQLLPLFGKGAALLLAAAWFGLGHYFGVPSGVTGVLITAIGGWFFGKSMVETRTTRRNISRGRACRDTG